MTPIYGITEAGVKKRPARIARFCRRPSFTMVNLTLTLPRASPAPLGMNALAHLVEGLYAQDANPIISLLALEGIRALARSLPIVVKEPDNIEAHSDALYGAWLGGTVLGGVGMAIHHKLCHTLGGSFNLPHAEVHTVILPYAIAYNQGAVPEVLAQAAEALDAKPRRKGIYDLSVKIGAPVALKDIGMPLEGLDRAAEIATQNPYYNPRPVDYAGRSPTTQRRLLRDSARVSAALLLPTTLVGSYPQPEWLITDRALLTGQMPPRTRLQIAFLARGAGVAATSAGRRHYPRDSGTGKRRIGHRDRWRNAPRELFEPVRHRA